MPFSMENILFLNETAAPVTALSKLCPAAAAAFSNSIIVSPVELGSSFAPLSAASALDLSNLAALISLNIKFCSEANATDPANGPEIELARLFLICPTA